MPPSEISGHLDPHPCAAAPFASSPVRLSTGAYEDTVAGPLRARSESQICEHSVLEADRPYLVVISASTTARRPKSSWPVETCPPESAGQDSTTALPLVHHNGTVRRVLRDSELRDPRAQRAPASSSVCQLSLRMAGVSLDAPSSELTCGR